MEHMMSGLVLITGLSATGLGVVTALSRFRTAVRTSRKIENLCATMPEGWGSWFFGGFSQLAVGTSWLRAISVLIGWTLAGMGLMWLGLQAVWRL